ncbi:hypothetical protein ASD56_02525 [Microbacterium sp. Root166]|uniref:hypothetical protein n=1 Tax=Microbacterium sp. Root166 TaxID=1736478 RepID=UPI0006FEEAF2|nr:hypothetical protein [Microbacterium sp. Root166]KQZ85257.1 hypothetical protein ASD56_02525 [Microbacterium sp. Root166]
MDIVVDSGGVHIAAPETLTSFSVLSSLPLDEIDAALRAAELGHVHDGHAWISAHRLETRAAALVTEQSWTGKYRGMLAYAVSRGWWDEEHSLIRAHVRRA